jgi:hypothetical protein
MGVSKNMYQCTYGSSARQRSISVGVGHPREYRHNTVKLQNNGELFPTIYQIRTQKWLRRHHLLESTNIRSCISWTILQ